MADFRRHVGRRVIVQLDAYSLDGTLTLESSTALTLEAAEVLVPGSEPKPIDGEVVVPLMGVEWVQVV